MKPQTDSYHFSETSVTGKYGFECFQNQEDGNFYFHFNNEAGQAVLYSQPYKSARSRENAIQSVIANSPKPERFEVSDDKNNPYFIIKAGNHQAIGQSPTFSAVAEMEAAKKLLMVMDNPPIFEREEEIDAGTPQNAVPETQPATSQSSRSTFPTDLPRHSFSVKVYGEPLGVQITHVLTQNQATFQTLSGEKITEFIMSYLPEEWKQNFENALGNKMAAPPPTNQMTMPTSPEGNGHTLTGQNGNGKIAGTPATETAAGEDLPNPAQPKIVKQPSLDDVIVAFMNEDKGAKASKDFSPREVREMLRKTSLPPEPAPAENEVDAFIRNEKINPLVEASRTSNGEDVVDAMLRSKVDLREFVEGKQKKVSFNTDFLKGERPAPPPKISMVEEFINGKGTTVIFETYHEEEAIIGFSEILHTKLPDSTPASKKDVVDSFMRSANCGCSV
ncbi:MAG: YegP family protein [Saprospiraceae bacterium]